MSRLTDRQLQAAIERSEATEARYTAAGDKLRAAAAHGRAHRNREELKRRQHDTAQDGGESDIEQDRRNPQPRRQLDPSTETTWEAVPKIAAILAEYGAAQTIRALDHALLSAPIPATAAADVADGVRLMQMRRKHATQHQESEAAQ